MEQNIETDGSEARDEIARLEQRIDQLAAQIENCRKFSLMSRAALLVGGIVLLAIMLGAIPSNPTAIGAAIVAVLGGIVVLGSNDSTAKSAKAEMAAAEAYRAQLIGTISLRVVSERPTLH